MISPGFDDDWTLLVLVGEVFLNVFLSTGVCAFVISCLKMNTHKNRDPRRLTLIWSFQQSYYHGCSKILDLAEGFWLANNITNCVLPVLCPLYTHYNKDISDTSRPIWFKL